MRFLKGFLYDKETYQITPFFGEQSELNEFETSQKNISEERLDICKTCSKVEYDSSTQLYKCTLCGCGLMHKIKHIFPVDENGHAFNNVNPYTKEKIHVCKLKKW